MQKRLLEEWNDSRTAALFLKPCTPKHLNEELGPQLERKSGNRPTSSSARGGGWLYHRHDLERLRAIMDAIGCNAAKALWLLHGIRRLGARKMLPELELTLAEAVRREDAHRESLERVGELPRTQRLHS